MRTAMDIEERTETPGVEGQWNEDRARGGTQADRRDSPNQALEKVRPTSEGARFPVMDVVHGTNNGGGLGPWTGT